MINGKRVLAVIPARGGSKGIPHKNIKKLCGKPLIAHTIEAAKSSAYIDSIYVSTDSARILHVAQHFGVRNTDLRPRRLAQDNSKTIDAMLHSIAKNPGFDILILLQPTSPCRDANDIDRALELFMRSGMRSLVSVHPIEENPILIRFMNSDNELTKAMDVPSTVRRQDMPKPLRVNGAIYINRIDQIDSSTSFNDNEIGFEMEPEHSVDIDTIEDFKLASRILKTRYKR